MIDEWMNFWAKYLSIILLTIFFTFIGVMGKYLKNMKKNKEKFNLKAFLTEFFISLSLTIFLAFACISQDLDILTTCIVVGVAGHFGTNGIISLICKYIKLDCQDLIEKKEVNNELNSI